MIGSGFADYSKKIAHFVIDIAVPSTPAIATASALIGGYAHLSGLTYSQGRSVNALVNTLSSMFGDKIGSALGYTSAPLIVPFTSPQISLYIGIGASCATSITLNLISKRFFRIDSPKVADVPSTSKEIPAATKIPPLFPLREKPIATIAATIPVEVMVETAPSPPEKPEIALPALKTVPLRMAQKRRVSRNRVKPDFTWFLCHKPRLKRRPKTLLAQTQAWRPMPQVYQPRLNMPRLKRP